MASKNKKAVLGDSDSIQSNGSSDMPLDPIESHTHCCAIDFDETVRQVSAIKGELGDIATHTMVNTLNQLKYIKAIKDRSERKKRVATIPSYPQRVSSSSLNTKDVLDVTAVPESEKPYSKRLIRVPGPESEPLAISSLRPHSEEDGIEKQGGLRQGSVHVMKHSADADTSEENYLFELPRRSSIAETKGESVPGGRRHSRVLSLKQIPSEVSVNPLADYLKRNASNFRKSLGERDFSTESGVLGLKEQVQERVSNDSVLTPEQRLSERDFPINARLDEQDNLDNQKVDDVIAPKDVPEDEDNKSISKKSDEDLASKYSKKSGEDLTPKYVSEDEDDKLVIQKSEEDISAKDMSMDEDKKSVDQGSDEDIVTKSVSEDDFPEVLSLGDVEDSSIQIRESDEIFTIEMSEDYLPDVASMLVEETKDVENEQERVVPQKISGEKINGTRISPVPSYKEEPEEKNQAGKDLKISKDVQESLQKEVILPPISLIKEPVTKVESKESIAEQTDSNAAAADEKSPRKPKVRTLNTENMKNRDYYYMDILPKQTDSIIQFTIDSKLGNKKVKCDFSGNVSVKIIVSDDKVGETRSRKPKLKVLDLSNDEGTKIEKAKRRKVSFDDQTGKRILKRMSQLHVYILLANNYSSLLTYLLKFEENSYCRNKTECLEFDTKNQKQYWNRSPSDGAANGKNLSTSSLSILNLMNAIIYITRFLHAAERSKFVENFIIDFSELFYQEKTSNVYHEFPRFFNYNNKHETVSVAETVKFLTLFRFPEFYEKISENNKFQVMPLEQKRKPFHSFNDIDNEGNIQINLIGASSDTVTVAKKEESDNGKNYNVFEIVIPHKPSFKQKRAEATASDDESAEYRLYKKSYGEPRAVSATRDSRPSKVSNKSEGRRSVLFADETTVHDSNNVAVSTAETQKDTAPLYQSGEPNELQQTSGTQETDIGESNRGTNDEYPDDENVNQMSDAQPEGSRFDPNSNNYIYAAAPRFASPFADQSGRPLPDQLSGVEIFESDIDNMPEFVDVADAKYRVDKRITSSPKKGDPKQPISENVKPEQEKITADLHPISEKVQPEKYKRNVKSQPEREKFLSGSEKTDEKLQAVPNAVQPHEELAQQDRLVPSISDMDISKRRVPIKNITPEQSLAGTEPEVNFPSISEKREYDTQLDTRAIKPPSQQGKNQLDEHTDAHKRHDYETDALQYPEKAGHKKFNTETSIVPDSKVNNGKYGEDMYSPRGSISHSYEDQPLKPDKVKYSPHDSLSPSHKEQPMKPDEGKYSPYGSLSPLHEGKPMKPVEGKYSPRGSLSPSYEERPTKPVEGKYSPRGSVSPSHEERPMKPVEGKYSPHGIMPPSDKEKPMKPVEGKYSPHDSLSPSHKEQPMKPDEGKYSPYGSLSPLHEGKPMKPVEGKYSPRGSLSPSYEERPTKPVEGKYSPRGSVLPSHEERPMKPVEGKYSPHGIMPPSDKEKPMKPVEGKYSPHDSLSHSYEERPMKPVTGKYSPRGSLSPSHEEQPMKPVEEKYSPHGSLLPSREEQPMKPVEGKYSPHGILPPSDKERRMKPVEGEYSPYHSLSPSYEERPMKLVTGKYSARGSLSPSHEEQPMKPVEEKYSPYGSLLSLHEGKPMKPVEGKYSPRGTLSPLHEEQPMKPVEGKYSPHGSLSHSYEEQPMEPVAGKYSPHGSLLPSREEQPMKSVTGKDSPHDSLSPSYEERPMKLVTDKYSPRGSLSPSHEKQPMKPVAGKYSPHGILPPSNKEQHMKSVDFLSYPHKDQPMKPVEGKYSPHDSLSLSHKKQLTKPITGKYSPHDSLSPLHEEQPMKPVEGKYSPRGSLLHSYEKQPMEPVAGKYSPHGSLLPSREEQPMNPVTGKYSTQDSLSPSREGQPMKSVEDKYSSLLSPRDKQPSKAVQGEYSPHGSISPSVEIKHPTPSSAEKQPISDSSYKSEAKIPKSHRRPEEILLISADSETSQIFEIPDIYEDKYTADKYNSLKTHWPYDKRSVGLSPEERQDTKAMAQKGSDTIRPKYLAGDPVSVKSKTPEETGDTKLKPVHEDIIDKKTYNPYREGINYGRNLDHDSLESEGEDSLANKTNGEKEDEYSPGKRSWLSSGEYVTPVEEPPFVKTLKEDDSQSRRVKFSDGTRPIRGDTRSILKPPAKPYEGDTFVWSPDTTEGLKSDRPKDRQGEQFMVYAGHVEESSPFLHKSKFDGSPVEPDDDHGSYESEASYVRPFNNMTAVDGKVNGPKSDNIFPYKNEQLVYAGEIEERSPFSYDEYMLQRELNNSRQQQDESYSQQRDPKYKQQRGPSYSQQDPSYSRQRDLSYSQQQDPSYAQQQDPSYSQQRDPRYSQKWDPSYSQQQDSSYSRQRDLSYSQQQDPSYAQQQYTSYSQQRDPSYSQQRDPGYEQQKDLNDFKVSSQLKKNDTGGTQKASFEESPETEISKYEVTLPQKQKRDDDQVETDGRAVIILVKAKHIVPKKNGKRNVVDSSQNELELEGERDKRKEGFKSDKNNTETMTEGDYDPDLIDDDETTFCTQGTQISTRGLVDSTRSSRTPSETLRKGERPRDSSRSRKDSKLKWSQEVEPAFYTEGTQTILKGEDIVTTKLSDEDKIRGEEVTDGTAYQSKYGPPDVTRRIESIVSQQSKMNGTRIPFSSTEEPEKTKRPTYSSDFSKSRKDTRLKSLPEDKTAFYNEGTQTILKGGDIVTTKISDKDKTPEVDVTNGTAYQSEYGSSDVTRRIESIVSQQSKENGTRISFLPLEEQEKGKRPTYDSSERRRDRKIKEALTRKEHESKWIADESRRRLEISKLPEFEVVASAAVSKLPMKNQPIQPRFYKGDLAYSMNVQSDSFNGTCNFYLDPKLRKVIRNVLIACADKKK